MSALGSSMAQTLCCGLFASLFWQLPQTQCTLDSVGAATCGPCPWGYDGTGDLGCTGEGGMAGGEGEDGGVKWSLRVSRF